MTITGAEPRTSARVAHWASILCFALGIALVGIWGFWTAYSAIFQRVKERAFERALAASAAVPGDTIREPQPPPAPGELVARMEVPRLRISAVVLEGIDDGSLRIAVGHVPGTGLPGEERNVGLAAHRDTFFRNLAGIKAGDEIELASLHGTHRYRVEWTRIVWPKDTWVLDDVGHGALTLVTCYPFHYVGAAPKRFIVRAALVPEPVQVGAASTHTPDANR